MSKETGMTGAQDVGEWPVCNVCDGRGCPSCEKTGFQFGEDAELAAYKFGIEQGKVLQRIAAHTALREARAALAMFEKARKSYDDSLLIGLHPSYTHFLPDNWRLKLTAALRPADTGDQSGEG